MDIHTHAYSSRIHLQEHTSKHAHISIHSFFTHAQLNTKIFMHIYGPNHMNICKFLKK